MRYLSHYILYRAASEELHNMNMEQSNVGICFIYFLFIFLKTILLHLTPTHFPVRGLPTGGLSV